MIDLSQWRASIGLWNNCRSTALDEINPSKNKMVSTSERKKGELKGEIQLIDNPPLTTGQPLLQSYCKSDTCTCMDTFDSTCDDSGGVWPTVTCLCLEICLLILLIILRSFLLLLLCGDIEVNPGPGNPHELLRSNSKKLTDAITPIFVRVITELNAKGLIPQATKNDLPTIMGLSDYDKASRLMTVIQQQLESSTNRDQYLIDICHVLINQQNQPLTDIATSLLQQLGQPVPNISPVITPVLPQSIDIQTPTATNSYGIGQMFRSIANSLFNRGGLPIDVQQYVNIMKNQYKYQPIVASDWPPKIGKDFFGRLTLAEKYFFQDTATWYILRGKLDELPSMYRYKNITINNLIELNDEPSSPLRVVVDGPPGIGKTTLCRKLCNMWANGTLTQYDLVLYCPLRNSKIAQATTLTDLFTYNCLEVEAVTKWIEETHGEGLLIIFDGWDELSTELRHSSLATSIIRKERLSKCSVIVMSRSYTSSSLLKLDSTIKHVQLLGFSDKEIATVVQATLENKELAEKLITDLKIREDIHSLCYIPLVCSMVIFVYRILRGCLPKTLTGLYKNFILQTIKRHVERTPGSSIEAEDISNLDNLPPALTTPLLEMCQFAYMNLKDNKMTFSSQQLHHFLGGLIKEDYFGLMTVISTGYEEKVYQFLHLSIQEFLAAWWITVKGGLKTDRELFKEHFYDDHFRMCLRFVAGLTHLKPEVSYEEYFNNPLDLQCKRRPLTGFQACRYSNFCQNPEMKQNHINFNQDFFPILLLQLLYESQNTTLCHVLAQSIINESLCLDRVHLSVFDMLCFSYFINNSKIKWNHLHLGWLSEDSLPVFTGELTSVQNQCKGLIMKLNFTTDVMVHKLLQPSLICNIEECYCEIFCGCYTPCLVLLEFLSLPHIKVLHLEMRMFAGYTPLTHDTDYSDTYLEIEQCLETLLKLQEMDLKFQCMDVTRLVKSIINGIAKNKSIKSLVLDVDKCHPGAIECLLKNNSILTSLALKMYIPDGIFLNISEVNTPITSLSVSGTQLIVSLLPYITGLHSLTLRNNPTTSIADLFNCHQNLQLLSLDIADCQSIIELFTILQTNTTLKGLEVKIKAGTLLANTSTCTSLQEMLIKNQTLHNLCIRMLASFYDNSYDIVPFLTSGLIDNTSLQYLGIPIPFSTNEQVTVNFFNAIPQKNITQLKIHFLLNQSFIGREHLVTSLFYEQILPAITNMLQSHTTIRSLWMECTSGLNITNSKDSWIETLKNFYKTVFLHPSLNYVGIWTGFHSIPLSTLKVHMKETLEDIHQQVGPLNRTPPVIDINDSSYDQIFCQHLLL